VTHWAINAIGLIACAFNESLNSHNHDTQLHVLSVENWQTCRTHVICTSYARNVRLLRIPRSRVSTNLNDASRTSVQISIMLLLNVLLGVVTASTSLCRHGVVWGLERRRRESRGAKGAEGCGMYGGVFPYIIFIENRLYGPKSPDLNPVDYVVWGLCSSTKRDRRGHRRTVRSIEGMVHVQECWRTKSYMTPQHDTLQDSLAYMYLHWAQSTKEASIDCLHPISRY